MKERYKATNTRGLFELHNDVNKHLQENHLPQTPSVSDIIGSLPDSRTQELAMQTFESQPREYFRLLRRVMSGKALSTVTKDWYYAEGLMRAARELTRYYDEHLAREAERTQRELAKDTIVALAKELLPVMPVLKGTVKAYFNAGDAVSRFQEINGLLLNRGFRAVRPEPSLGELTASAYEDALRNGSR